MRRSPSSAVVALVVAACGGAPREVAPACPMERAIVVAGQEDVAGLAGCTSASALVIRTGAALDLGPLRALETITGDLTIGPSVGLTEAAFGGLRAIGGELRVVANGDLHGLFLPRLVRAGRIAIEGNSGLATLAMPALREVTGALTVAGNPDLELIEASALEGVGGALVVADHPKLVVVEAGALVRAGGVRIANNPLLSDDIAAALQAKNPEP